MIPTPFLSLSRFDDIVDLRFMTRKDDIGSDADIARVTGVSGVVSLRQTHGNRAVVLREVSSRIEEADAVFTDVPDLMLTIRFADCQNAVIIVPERRVIGLVHAGWRGVQSRIMTSAYALLASEWGIRPAETSVGLGPSLCTRCAEFTDPEREVPELRNFFSGKSIDLRGALDAEMDEIGIPQNRRERLPDCTRCHPERYFTYRGGDRDLVKSGKVNCLAVSLR